MVDLSDTIALSSRKSTRGYDVTIINYAILAFIIFFGLAYLIAINSLGTQGYAIRQLEVKIRQVESKHKFLELEASSLQSISKLQDMANSSAYVPAGNVTYMKDGDFALK